MGGGLRCGLLEWEDGGGGGGVCVLWFTRGGGRGGGGGVALRFTFVAKDSRHVGSTFGAETAI